MQILEQVFYYGFFALLMYGAFVIIRFVYGLASNYGKCDNCKRFLTPIDEQVRICQHCIDNEPEA